MQTSWAGAALEATPAGEESSRRSEGESALRCALPFHHLGVERLRLAEVDEVLRRDVVRQHIGEILQPRRRERRRDAAEEGAEVLLALPLLPVKIEQAIDGRGQAVHRDLRHDLPEVCALVGAPAANHDEVLRNGLAAHLADTALETERRDVMLTAPVRTAADLDVARRYQVDQLGTTAEMLRQQAAKAA